MFLKGNGIHLELFHAEQALSLPAPTADGRALPSVIRHLAFKAADVDAKLAEMGEDGKRITLGPLSFNDFIPGWRSACLSDPEGNIIEISQGYVDQPDPPPLEA